MQFTPKLRDVRTALANRRTMRVAHRRLAGELASFRSTAERAELDELLSRHSAEETKEIRAILYSQDIHRMQTSGRVTAGLGGYLG
jgi:CRISPR/Cas system-associated protein Csm6